MNKSKSLSIINTFATKQNELLENIKGSKIKQKKSFKEDQKLTNNTKASTRSKEDIKKAASLANNVSTNEESYDIMIKKLRIHELEREITNLRGIIANIIIPKLNLVDIQKVN